LGVFSFTIHPHEPTRPVRPENIPDNLKHAHEHNDEVLERIYIGRSFKNDTERLGNLFVLYTKMTTTATKYLSPQHTHGKRIEGTVTNKRKKA